MFSPEILQTIVTSVYILVGIVALYVLWKYHNAKLLSQLLEAAKAAVMAAEQAKATGKLLTGDEQLTFAIDTLKIIFPQANHYSDAQILSVIHAAVPAANAVTAQIEAAWASVTGETKPLLPTVIQSPTLGDMG